MAVYPLLSTPRHLRKIGHRPFYSTAFTYSPFRVHKGFLQPTRKSGIQHTHPVRALDAPLRCRVATATSEPIDILLSAACSYIHKYWGSSGVQIKQGCYTLVCLYVRTKARTVSM